MSEHLEAETTSRGFMHLPQIPSEYGGGITVSESSAAMGPHIWVRMECPVDLNNPQGETKEAVAHLTLENARKLMEQLAYLDENHYQRQFRDFE